MAMSPPNPGTSTSPDNQPPLNTYMPSLEKLKDPKTPDKVKIEAIRELGENFDLIVTFPQYPSFLAMALKIILKILHDGEPHFIAESSNYQIRRLLLEMIHRIPMNRYLKPHIDSILALCFKMLKIDNEQIVSICLRIIIELHKQKRTVCNDEIKNLLHYICSIYQGLPNHVNKVFQPKTPISVQVNDLSEVDLNTILSDIYTVTPIHCSKVLPGGTISRKMYNVIPRGAVSLKVLQELPLIVGKIYEMYKDNVKNEVNEYISLSVQTISLQPPEIFRQDESFNKEVFVDFLVAQIKTIAFLAQMLRVSQESVEQHAESAVKGILGILTLCPPELTSLRRDLLVATRGILATNLRMMFVPYINQFFDEDVLLGRGWTTHEALRPLAYTTLADLINNVKKQLQMGDLVRAVHLLSKNLHDETLPTNIQTVSCEVLVNLVDCIRLQAEKDPSQVELCRNLYFRMLEVFVLKFKTIAKLQLPVLIAKCKQCESKNLAISSNLSQTNKADNETTSGTSSRSLAQTSDAPVQHRASVPLLTYIADCRNLVKFLVCGVKTISWRLKLLPIQDSRPRETELFIRLLKWGLQALDIYSIINSQSSLSIRAKDEHNVKTKEDKDVLEHFSGVFSVMTPLTFKAIFSSSIDYMIERIANNFALQTIGNSFLTNSHTSPIFITIILEYLFNRMAEMGNGDVERGNLYLKLFKLVFGSICVSQCRAANVKTLRPHIQRFVKRTLELAVTAKEPLNYFLFLRTLFKCSKLGNSNQDEEHSLNFLHEEFLPLLPSLLEGLSSFQSGQHKQHMKDLFVELCLTVPVRLSSLLSFLPMLMSPLVSALHGSPALVSQSLITLELCVDNPQTEFLKDNILPMRVELIQALWRCLRHPIDRVSLVAFRILGKFGGGNRKVLLAPQKLDYRSDASPEPSISVQFVDLEYIIELPIVKIIETSVTTLRQPDVDMFYRRKSWEIIRDFLLVSMGIDSFGNSEESTIKFLKQSRSFDSIPRKNERPYKCSNRLARHTCINALIGLFYALAVKDLAPDVQSVFQTTMRWFTLIALSHQIESGAHVQTEGMDALVVVDAIADIMGNEEKEFCKIGKSALSIIIETVTLVLGSKDAVCNLPLMESIAEKMYSLCYNRAWFAKLGGCIATRFLIESISLRWALQHLHVFVKAQFFVLVDLTGEISNGAMDEAKSNLHAFIELCAPLVNPFDKQLRIMQNSVFIDVILELERQITNPIEIVREQAMYTLNLIAQKQNKTVYEIMKPHKKILIDIVHPKRLNLPHLTLNAQIGLLEGYSFCYTLTPRLFPEDETKSEELKKKEKEFYDELMCICRSDDSAAPSITPLRIAAMKSLAAGYCVSGPLNDLFDVFYQALKSSHAEIQETAFESMKTLVAAIHINLILEKKDPLLFMSDDNKLVFSLSEARRLSYMVQLFPDCFTESVCDRYARALQNMILGLNASAKSESDHSDNERIANERIVATILDIFHQMPAAGPKLIEPLTSWVLQSERHLHVSAYSPFRTPLIKFLLRYPQSTVAVLLGDNAIKNPFLNDFLEYLIKCKEGKPFRDLLQSPQCVQRLIILAISANHLELSAVSKENKPDQLELRFQSVRIVSSLVKRDEKWLANQHQLAQTFIGIWCSDSYQTWHSKIEGTDYCHWKEPKLIVRILLNYFSHDPSNFLLLFQILRAFCYRFIPDFRFVKEFLDKTVSQSYSIDWKRMAFFKFAELFPSEHISQELKAKILQFVIIPCFNQSFKKNEGELLIGGSPSDPLDSPDNIISVFISKVIGCDKPTHTDAVKVYLLTLSCIFIENVFPHINDPQVMPSEKLKRIMNYAGPSLLTSNCTDPATRYHGHLLLCHIIANKDFPSNNYKKVILKAFCNLLKAHALEVRTVVRQALDVITPALSSQLDDGHIILTQWTKKILVEEGHNLQQLIHILQLIVRQQNVYYPVRHALVQRMITALQKLSLSASSNIENKKLGCELAEVIIQWEARRLKDKNEESVSEDSLKRSAPDEPDVLNKKGPGTSLTKQIPDKLKPLDKSHADTLINCLMIFACCANDVNAKTSGIESLGEILSRRCCILIRKALSPEFWPQYNIDFRLAWMNSLFCSLGHAELENPEKPVKMNIGNVCKGLELLTLALSVMNQETVKANCKLLQTGIIACVTCTNIKVIVSTRELLTKLMSIFPIESSTVPTKYEQLEVIYSTVAQAIADGINNYERDAPSNSSSLPGSIMMLDAACKSNPSYIDRIIDPFVRVICKMCGCEAKSDSTMPPMGDMLVWSLKVVKNRIGVMPAATREIFMVSILSGLIDMTQEEKVMRAIFQIVEEWVMANSKCDSSNSGPTLRETSILLVKLMQNINDRFPDLKVRFLELVNFIYRDDACQATELTVILEPAFLAGLRCSDPTVRTKFFDIFNGSMRRTVYDRLMFIICSQKWEMMRNHYWIKQCIELLLTCADDGMLLELSSKSFSLPRLSSIVQSHSDDLSMLIKSEAQTKDPGRRVTDFLQCVSQLCHMDSSLAARVWLDLFPRLWSVLAETDQNTLAEEIHPFIVSDCHAEQNDIHPSAFRTFFDGVALCEPPIELKQSVMVFVGKSFNLWHQVTLRLEKMVADQWNFMNENKVEQDILMDDDFEVLSPSDQFSVEHLAEMYSRLNEEDMWCALWQKNARYRLTATALAYEQQGFFEQALDTYERAIEVGKQDYYSCQPAPPGLMVEQRLWEQQSIRCCKELNRWKQLMDLGKTRGNVNPYLVMDSAWRIPDWSSMSEAVAQAQSCPKDLTWKVYLYRSYLALARPGEDIIEFERYVQIASSLCILEWRKLPRIVSHSHVPLLQAAQQIRELQEAHLIHQNLAQKNNNNLQDVESIVKTWASRLPVISDDLSHWSDILTWRQHHYETIARHCAVVDSQSQGASHSSAFGVHESVQALIHFGKIARKHNLIDVCQKALARIHTNKEVLLSDVFQNVRQQVKSYVHKASSGSSASEGLKTVLSIGLKFFTKEMTAEIDAIKGTLHASLGRPEEAEKTFSASANAVPDLSKTWALWGDFCETQFMKSQPLDMSLGVRAVECFLHACRHQNESKTRKYLAKVIWLLTYDDKDFKITQAVAKKVIGIPAIHWVPWIPQLLTCLTRDEGEILEKLINQVGDMFPQAVYFPLSTMYRTLKNKKIEESKQTDPAKRGIPDMAARKAFSPAMMRCCKMIKNLMVKHSTILTALDVIVDQLANGLEENWFEEILRRLKPALAKCYSVAYENRRCIREATVTRSLLNFFKSLVEAFAKRNQALNLDALNSQKVRAKVEALQEIMKQLSSEFNFESDESKKLLNLMFKLKKWVKKLEEIVSNLLPKSFLIDERTRFFSIQSADVELPGEYLAPKHSHHRVKISRFLPRVEIVYKHNGAARTLLIRGNNGRVYPYLVLNDFGNIDGNREERVLQLLRMLNHCLGKHKETSRRFLRFTVPRVVAVSKQIRLVEENRSSVSLLDVFVQSCPDLRIDPDAPITKYYDSLRIIQEPNDRALKDIFNDVQSTMIPKTLLKQWAERTYQTPEEYWVFRKMFTLQMALACFCEYILRMSRLNPGMLYMLRDSGLVNVSYFKFDIEDSKNKVPFRLTPNIQEFITDTGIAGPLTASMIACARCLIYPNFKVNSILRAILRDEMIVAYSLQREDNNASREDVVRAVTFFTDSINQRMNRFAHFDGAENHVTQLVDLAMNDNNLCLMDPAWNPWL